MTKIDSSKLVFDLGQIQVKAQKKPQLDEEQQEIFKALIHGKPKEDNNQNSRFIDILELKDDAPSSQVEVAALKRPSSQDYYPFKISEADPKNQENQFEDFCIEVFGLPKDCRLESSLENFLNRLIKGIGRNRRKFQEQDIYVPGQGLKQITKKKKVSKKKIQTPNTDSGITYYKEVKNKLVQSDENNDLDLGNLLLRRKVDAMRTFGSDPDNSFRLKISNTNYLIAPYLNKKDEMSFDANGFPYLTIQEVSSVGQKEPLIFSYQLTDFNYRGATGRIKDTLIRNRQGILEEQKRKEEEISPNISLISHQKISKGMIDLRQFLENDDCGITTKVSNPEPFQKNTRLMVLRKNDKTILNLSVEIKKITEEGSELEITACSPVNKGSKEQITQTSKDVVTYTLRLPKRIEARETPPRAIKNLVRKLPELGCRILT